MAESDKSRYNVRFSFANPTGEMSASRSTRYRSKKKRKLDTFPEGQVDSNMEEQHQDSYSAGGYECESESDEIHFEEQPQQQDSYNGAGECEFSDDPEIEITAAPHDFFNLEPEESDKQICGTAMGLNLHPPLPTYSWPL